MTLVELIDAAKRGKGSLGAVAEGLGIHQSAMSEWKKGKRQPSANQIAYLAECAGLPVLQTVAEIEAQLDDRYASIWREALGKLTAAGVTAAVVATTSLSPTPANATTTCVKRGLYIMSTDDAGKMHTACEVIQGKPWGLLSEHGGAFIYDGSVRH